MTDVHDYAKALRIRHVSIDAEMLASHNVLLDDMLDRMRMTYQPGTASSDANGYLVDRFWRVVRGLSYEIEARLIAEGLRP